MSSASSAGKASEFTGENQWIECGWMTANEFRKIASDLPGVVESAHMEHPDFRVGGRIFASLGYPDEQWGMVTLPPDEQARLTIAEPDVFLPAPGTWGRAGSTLVRLTRAKPGVVSEALQAAHEERIRKNGQKGKRRRT